MRRGIQRSGRVLALALLIGAGAASAYSGLHGLRWEVPPSIPPLRVGSSPQAMGVRIVYMFENHRPASASIQDMYVRTGAEYVAGTWTFSARACETCAVLGSTSVSLLPNEWNRITFSPPIPLAGVQPFQQPPRLYVEGFPVGAAEIDFVGTWFDFGDFVRAGDNAEAYVSVEARTMKTQSPDGGATGGSRGLAVLTLAGEVDPWAPASCTGPDAIAVTGNPYFASTFVPLSSTQPQQQTFLLIDYPSTPPDYLQRIFQLELGGPNIGNSEYVMTATDGGIATGTFFDHAQNRTCFIANTVGPSLEVNTIDVTSAVPDAGWGLFMASPTPLGECHPVARATFGGSLARAVVNGVPMPEADFAFQYELSGGAHFSWADNDGDGHGDPDGGGYCHDSWILSQDDCDDTNPQIKPGAQEICDSHDNDCNGLVDADDPSMAVTACERQGGVCGAKQHPAQLCVDGGFVECGADVYGAPFEEVELTCDGEDNDCDGVTDDPDALEPAPCARQQGICAGTVAPACVGHGGWASCDLSTYGPDFELIETRCDGLDNDCDGLTDGEDEVAAPACELTVGVCSGATPSIDKCGAQGWAACVASDYGPDFEAVETRCDGLDNDCDGAIDDTDPDLVISACELTEGVCAGALHSRGACQATGWSACGAADYGLDYEAQEQSCDGLDNDCDGHLDAEDPELELPPCPKQKGVCAGARHALSECSTSGWTACVDSDYGGDYEANESSCDGLDNDCDGLTDEGCSEEVGQGCGTAPSVPGGTAWLAFALTAFISLQLRRRRRTELRTESGRPAAAR